MVYPSPLTPIHHSSSYSVETHTSIQEGAPAGMREEQEEPSQAPSTSTTSAPAPITTSMEPGTPTTSWVCDLRNGCEGYLIKIPSAPQPQPLPPQQDSCPADTNTVMCSEVIEMNSVKLFTLPNSLICDWSFIFTDCPIVPSNSELTNAPPWQTCVTCGGAKPLLTNQTVVAPKKLCEGNGSFVTVYNQR